MTNQVIIGRIDSIRTKQVHTKFGDKSVYIALINGQEVNLGFKHNFSEGETVSIEAEHKYGSLQYVGPAQPGAVATPPEAVAQAASRPTPKSAFPVEPSANGTSICRQSSLRRAIDVMEHLQDSGYYVPSNEKNYLAKLFELAYLFTDFTTGQREVKAARAQQATQQAMADSPPVQIDLLNQADTSNVGVG